MLRNYFKTGLRFLMRNRGFSLINISGLALGTLCCLYILLYVREQKGYDRHHDHASDIYRLTTDLQLPGDKHHNATTSPPIAPAIKAEFPEVEQYVRVVGSTISISGTPNTLVRYNDRSFYVGNIRLADSTFFDVMTYHFTAGRQAGALAEPNSVVLTAPVALQLFGRSNPIGKTISVADRNSNSDFKITGVVDESLGKTHLEGSMFINLRGSKMGRFVLENTQWAGNNFTNSYLKLRPGASAAALEAKLPDFLQRHAARQLQAISMTKQLRLQPITSIHTTGGYESESSQIIDSTLLSILTLIAILIQVIACINFMNLSTARASQRALEVGVRKVIGAGAADLVRQFLGESFLLTGLAVVLAVPLMAALLPWLNSITGSTITTAFLGSGFFWAMIGAVILVTAFVAGSYPAFYLSRFQAAHVIKGNTGNKVSAGAIRRTLVVFQFVLSIILITGIIIIYSQLNYIRHKDLGFDPSQRVVLSFFTPEAKKQLPAIAQDLRGLSGVREVGMSDNFLSQFVPRDFSVFLKGGDMSTATDAQNMLTDEHFAAANGIRIISGRDFRPGDSGRLIINETLAARLGISAEKAPGTFVYDDAKDPTSRYEIIGVARNFNYNSLHGEVKPFMLMYDNHDGDFNYLIVSTTASNYTSLLEGMQHIWQKNLSSVPFSYRFLDDAVQKQYESDIMVSRIMNAFTLMAIMISGLGLFGLAAFSAEQRKKEIGVRKVLGATTPGLVRLLSTDFVRLVGIAFIIATPLAVIAMNHWLSVFAYRVSLSWWMFALSGVLALFIALATVSFQAVKAARANPILSLRTE